MARKRLHATVFVELMLGLAKAVALAFVDDELDVAAAAAASLDEGPALLDRHDRIGVAVQHEQRRGRQRSTKLIGERSWYSGAASGSGPTSESV